MKRILSVWLGWRFYRARQSNGFISFISFASTAGIALGVAVLIVMLSAMNGFEHELEKRLLSVIPHGELTGIDKPIANWQKIVTSAKSIDGIVASAPFVRLQGLIQKPGGFQGLSIIGIDPKLESKVSDIAKFMSPQSWQSLSKSSQNNIVIGQELADNLGLKVGDIVSVYTPSSSKNKHLALQKKSIMAAKSHRFVVTGIFNLGGALDLTTAYIPLAYGAKILGLEKSVTGVRIKVADVFTAPQLIRKLGYRQSQYLYLTDWTRTQGYLYKDIQLVRMIMYIVLTLVMAVACFNIISTLVMAVRDKQTEIAILLTMGMTKTAVMVIFIVQGAFNGFLGCLLGGSVGVLIAANLSTIASKIEQLFGIQLLSADVYFIDFLPSQLQWQDVVIVITLGLLMSIIATLYPAWKAGKILPARALAGR